MNVTVVKLIAILTLVLFTAPLVAGAQQAGKVYRIGVLGGGSTGGPFRPVFEQALRELGWATGQNLVITYRDAEGKYERLPVLAAELVRLEPQVIVTRTTAAAQAVKGATGTIPSSLGACPIPSARGSSLASPARVGT